MLTEIQKTVLQIVKNYPIGREITSDQIANQAGVTGKSLRKWGSDLRAIVNNLRKKGFLICANGSGYYYASSWREAERYCEAFQHRINEQQEALDGMRNIINNPKSYGKVAKEYVGKNWQMPLF